MARRLLEVRNKTVVLPVGAECAVCAALRRWLTLPCCLHCTEPKPCRLFCCPSCCCCRRRRPVHTLCVAPGVWLYGPWIRAAPPPERAEPHAAAVQWIQQRLAAGAILGQHSSGQAWWWLCVPGVRGSCHPCCCRCWCGTAPRSPAAPSGYAHFSPHMPTALQMNRDVADALVGACTGVCRLWLDHTVSLHTHGRTMSSYQQAGVAVRHFLHNAAVYAAAFEPLEELAAGLRS